jgi:hypothetical protein
VEGAFMSAQEQEAHVGMKVRVHEDHRISELRGIVGKVVGSYGGTEFIALEVHFPDGRYQLFWPGDLEAVASPKRWWRSLLGRRRS